MSPPRLRDASPTLVAGAIETPIGRMIAMLLTQFLLENGASWTEEHGYGDNACGTLSWASLNEPVADGNWVACAEVLLAHGMPPAQRNLDDPGRVLVAGRPKQFSDDVTAVLLGEEGELPS